jgi:nitrite reductase/ring-hydroxylating ferredoxin subunit/uncharacterized membrane protein
VESAADRAVRGQGWLDAWGALLQQAVGGFYRALGAPGREIEDAAHGTRPLGHPLHPAITDVPVGAWTVAVVADLVALVNHAFPTAAGDIALAVGLAAAIPALATGLTDHLETADRERRVATLHGLLMVTASLLLAASLLLRWVGPTSAHGPAVALAVAGLLVALVAAYFGGHLTFGMGTAVNRNAWAGGPRDFVDAGASADVPEGAMRPAVAAGAPVLLARVGGRLYGIGGVCSHAGAPLGEGSLDGDVVTCPWHGSRFCVRDGSVAGGPATFAQPRMDVRERDGRVEVRLAAERGGG